MVSGIVAPTRMHGRLRSEPSHFSIDTTATTLSLDSLRDASLRLGHWPVYPGMQTGGGSRENDNRCPMSRSAYSRAQASGLESDRTTIQRCPMEADCRRYAQQRAYMTEWSRRARTRPIGDMRCPEQVPTKPPVEPVQRLLQELPMRTALHAALERLRHRGRPDQPTTTSETPCKPSACNPNAQRLEVVCIAALPAQHYHLACSLARVNVNLNVTQETLT